MGKVARICERTNPWRLNLYGVALFDGGASAITIVGKSAGFPNPDAPRVLGGDSY